MYRPSSTADKIIEKTKLQIINRLWGHIYDLLLYIEGNEGKTIDQIQQEIDLTEYYCRPYAGCDDDELHDLELLQTVRRLREEERRTIK